MQRYDTYFKKWWTVLKLAGVVPEMASVAQITDGLIRLHKVNVHTARHAYSAMLVLPAYSALQAFPPLKPHKKLCFAVRKSMPLFGTHPK